MQGVGSVVIKINGVRMNSIDSFFEIGTHPWEHGPTSLTAGQRYERRRQAKAAAKRKARQERGARG